MEEKLSPRLLVASPHLRDPNFDHTVVFVFEHDEEGAVGLVVNRAVGIQLGAVLDDLEIPGTERPASPVHYGGPVSMEIGWVIHGDGYSDETTRAVAPEVFVSTSRDVLSAIAHGDGPERYMLCLGYAGWGGGQLEGEIAEGAWLVLPVEDTLLFEVPVDDRWARAYERLGIDPHQFSIVMGSA